MKIAITGKPGAGKTTLVKKLFNEFGARNKQLSGFYTEELRERGQRKGFDIIIFESNIRLPLARKERGNPRIGKYKAFPENVEKALELLKPSSLYIIDEVGKMELLSSSFRNFIHSLLIKKDYILTYGMGIDITIRKEIETRSRTFILTKENRERLYTKISNLIEG